MFVPKPLEKTIFNSAIASTGDPYSVVNFIYKTVVAKFSGTGATTFVIEVSNDGSNWVVVDTMTGDDYYETDVAIKFIRGRLTIAGGKTVKADLTANK